MSDLQDARAAFVAIRGLADEAIAYIDDRSAHGCLPLLAIAERIISRCEVLKNAISLTLRDSK